MKQEHKQLIKKAVEAAKQLYDNQKTVSTIMDISPEWIVFEKSNVICQMMVDLVSDTVGDTGRYLEWYCYENDFGNGWLMCYIGKKAYVCQSVTQLINMIDRHNKHLREQCEKL